MFAGYMDWSKQRLVRRILELEKVIYITYVFIYIQIYMYMHVCMYAYVTLNITCRRYM